MPPKRKSEQYDKINKNKSFGINSATRPARNRPANKSHQPSEPRSSRSIPPWRLPKNASTADYKAKIESLWKNMGSSRAGERQDAIKNGLIADPNKRTTLANAIRVVGTCQDMCPEFERIQRIRENAVDRAEKVTIHGGVKVADELRMVKAFHRPDAGKEEQLPSDLRPPPILHKTVQYLLDKVASPSASLAEHHKFVWDRTRCIRNDFTIQASGRLEDIKITIQCYEGIARFHILSLHQMPKIGKHDYDAQQELEQLSATLLSLFELYDDNRGKYEAPREPEFRAYKLIMDIRSRTNDTFERVQTWPPRVRDSFHVQTAVQLCQASGHLFTDTASMLSPYSRAMRVEQASYEKFWSILESPKVDYLMACAATVSFNEVRARTLETMIKVYRSGPQSRMKDISLEELTFALGLDSIAQTRKFFRDTGLHISQHADGSSYLDVDGLPGTLPKSTIASADQLFSRSIVEAKREHRTFGAIYSGFDVAYCKEHDLIDEAESDADFEPDAEDMDSEDENEETLFVEDEEEEDQKSAMQTSNSNTNGTGNPFGRLHSREPSPQPTAFATGGFGQPSGAQPIQSSATQPSTFVPSSNPFSKSSPFMNPITSVKQPQSEPQKLGLFNQSTFAPSKPQENNSAAPLISTGVSSTPSISTASVIAQETPSVGLFQFKAPSLFTAPTTTVNDPTSAPGLLGTTNDNQPSAQSSQAPKPLFPFTFPPAAKRDTAEPTDAPLQPLQSTKPSLFSNVPTSTAPLFPKVLDVSATPATVGSPQTFTQFAPLSTQPAEKAPVSEPGISGTTKSSSVSSLQPTPLVPSTSVFPQAASSPTVARQPGVSSSISPPISVPSLDKIDAPSKQPQPTPPAPIRPIISQKQKDDVLDKIAEDLALGTNGIIAQFIEAELGPIYDKAQRIVTKERTQARLEEIKQSLLGEKFLYIWKQRVDQRMRRKRAIERRQRMRQSHQEDSSREQSVTDVSVSGQGRSNLNKSNTELKYLTRGFDETFEQSTSHPQSSTLRKGRESLSAELEVPAFLIKNVTRSVPGSHTLSRHSRAHTLDGSIRARTNTLSSSSMPPPDNIGRSRLAGQTRSNELKSFVGTGYLQSPALRGEAIDFARRSGSITTTSSDYFRLKARNIDPGTQVVPSSRKRLRESSGAMDGFLTKTRRLSESTTSTISLSESTRELLANSSLSESTRSFLNGQLQPTGHATDRSTSPRYTDEEDGLFEAARKLRETLAEDTTWMRSMREEQEKLTHEANAETPAQRRLREFKATPSKTSVRLRQTHANGLLPPDYFEKNASTKDKQPSIKYMGKDSTTNESRPIMGLATLPNHRPGRIDDTSRRKESPNVGASIDDAIEL